MVNFAQVLAKIGRKDIRYFQILQKSPKMQDECNKLFWLDARNRNTAVQYVLFKLNFEYNISTLNGFLHKTLLHTI